MSELAAKPQRVEPIRRPVASVQKLVEELLEQVKSGEVTGLAYVTLQRGRYVGEAWDAGDGSRMDLLGPLRFLEARIVHSISDDNGSPF